MKTVTVIWNLRSFVVVGDNVIPGWSEGPDPESRDSGFDASRRPGMTGLNFARQNYSLAHRRCFGYHRTMKAGPDIAVVASLMGDPARANMLTALMTGRALTASELAQEAGVTPQTASSHLAKLEA